MLVWNRDRSHRFLSPDDREYYICEMATDNSYKLIKFFSTIINIAVPLTLYYFYGLNLFIFGMCFICLDIFLNLFEQIAFITIPYLLSKIKNYSYVSYKVERMKRKKKKAEDKIFHIQRKKCHDCDRTWYKDDCNMCKEMKLLREIKNELTDKIHQEEKFLQKIVKNKKKQKKEKTQPQISETHTVVHEKPKTESQKDYFGTVAETLNEFINKEHFDCLIPLRKSANSMSQILMGKPNGKSIIPVSIYTKIDGIIVLLSKIIELEKGERTQYLDELKTISKDISDEMQKIIIDINRLGKEEPKNEIDDLLKELMKKEENKSA